jgi:hypothetical protein
MDGLTWFFVIFFGLGALVPAVWSIVGLIGGNTKFWPGVFGTIFALGLLTVTFIGIATKWGGCPTTSTTSEGAIKCYKKASDDKAACEPDIWKLECNTKPREKCGKGVTAVEIPPKAYCPTGYVAVFSFCEVIKWDQTVKQPWATWSDLSFVAAGLWVLWFLHFYERQETTRMADNPGVDNPMMMTGWLSVVYGLIVIFMGPPSQWYHASMKDWGGWFDTMSVVTWMGFNAVYVIYSLARTIWGEGRKTERTIIVMSSWFFLLIICGLIAILPQARTPLYFVAGVPWGIAEVVYLIVSLKRKTRSYTRNGWLFGLNFLLLGGTMLLWGFYNDGIAQTGCVGRSWYPGHATFHIMASFSCVLTFLSFKSERAAGIDGFWWKRS